MSSNTLTYDEGVPRRPGLNDVGGAAFQNNPQYPPHPGEEPMAEDFNQTCKQVVALAAVAWSVLLYVKFASGTPSIFAVYSTRTGLVAGDFTVVDNGVGDTSITHTGGKLPAETVPAFLSLAADIEIDRQRAFRITNGWRVKTKLGGTGTDCDFVLAITGLS